MVVSLSQSVIFRQGVRPSMFRVILFLIGTTTMLLSLRLDRPEEEEVEVGRPLSARPRRRPCPAAVCPSVGCSAIHSSRRRHEPAKSHGPLDARNDITAARGALCLDDRDAFSI